MNSLFFIHNPKAAGSALRSLLSTPFNASEIAPVFSNSPYDVASDQWLRDNLSGFRFYAGHYGFRAYQALASDHALVTNFRDPARRIASLYRYWRNDVELNDLKPEERIPVKLAKDLAFGDFIRHPESNLRLYIENFHFRQLMGCGWTVRHSLVLYWLTVRCRIARMPWFFIQEEPTESLILLQAQFPNYANLVLPLINTSGGREGYISDEDRAYLAKINRFDYGIYRFARRLHSRRFVRQSRLT
jgi:hypothetical protein